jgi:hypothetical protein
MRKFAYHSVGGRFPSLFVFRKINGSENETAVQDITRWEPSGTRRAPWRSGRRRAEWQRNGSADLAPRKIDQPDIALAIVPLGTRASRSLGGGFGARVRPQPHLVWSGCRRQRCRRAVDRSPVPAVWPRPCSGGQSAAGHRANLSAGKGNLRVMRTHTKPLSGVRTFTSACLRHTGAGG